MRLKRSALVRVGAALAVVGAVLACGVVLYTSERAGGQRTEWEGDDTSADRVQVAVFVQKMDTASQELMLRVLPEAQGALAQKGASLVPAKDLTLDTTSLLKGKLEYPAGDRISFTDLRTSVEGTPGDYPFDRYKAVVGFAADVPVELGLRDDDPLFQFRIDKREVDEGYAGFEITLERSRGTVLLVWLMMVTMWGLALAVLAATWIIVGQRRGLVWPAMGWMAATLFALVGFRNAAPGGPPMGSVIDYAAFLWAELIVAGCLICVAAVGTHVEHRTAARG